MIDLAIRNGWLIDGTGGPRHRADIGIQGEQDAIRPKIRRRRSIGTLAIRQYGCEG